jgi:hypothetical protein
MQYTFFAFVLARKRLRKSLSMKKDPWRQSEQKLQIFVTYTVYKVVTFYQWFLVGQAFYDHFESIV